MLAEEGLLPTPTLELSDSDSEAGGEEGGEEGGEGGDEGGGKGGAQEDGEAGAEAEAAADEAEEWLSSGHELVGQRVARVFPTKRGHERVVMGTVSMG